MSSLISILYCGCNISLKSSVSLNCFRVKSANFFGLFSIVSSGPASDFVATWPAMLHQALFCNSGEQRFKLNNLDLDVPFLELELDLDPDTDFS